MKTNEGTADRLVRLGLAVAAAVGAIALGPSTPVGVVLLVATAILVVTAATGFCPLYRVLGVSTCKVPANR